MEMKNDNSVTKEAEAQRKKRLGQFFSGGKLARMLSALAGPHDWGKAIDPMSGRGDMLKAVRELSPKTSLFGMDIDQRAVNECIKSLKGNEHSVVLHGDAFSSQVIRQLPEYNFDLVITNPPYVRYQSLSKSQDELPSSEEIRKGLLDIIPLMTHLEDEDKNVFTCIVKNYSGLADLAVPSWILCAMLTDLGGRLAMVVPEAWLNRDYAQPIHYMLIKFFRIKYVVEDINRVWFDEAQVKTNLIIAERIKRRINLEKTKDDERYLHIGVSNSCSNEASIVGRIYPNSELPERLLFNDLIENNIKHLEQHFTFHQVALKTQLINLFSILSSQKWFRTTEERFISSNIVKKPGIQMPTLLAELIEGTRSEFCTLGELGVKIGQGLRTGANKFFYLDYLKKINNDCLVRPSKSLLNNEIIVPSDALGIVLRKQSELPNGYCLDASLLKGRVLLLKKYLHPEDYKQVKHLNPQRAIMQSSLANFVKTAATTNVGTEKEPKYIPKLSAVRTNIREIKDNDPDNAKYWYMLPQLAERHLPDLFVARVNGDKTKFIMNSSPKVIIDANFSTIWIDDNANIDKYSLLALLNTDWILLATELIGAIMGGGALKLEATQLRKIPIPKMRDQYWKQLSKIGKKLLAGDDALWEANNVINGWIFGELSSEKGEIIKNFLQTKVAKRKKR